jgi:hypothetical protein
MTAELLPTSEAAASRRFQVTHELVLAAVLAVEVVVFAALGTNFLTRDIPGRGTETRRKTSCSFRRRA